MALESQKMDTTTILTYIFAGIGTAYVVHRLLAPQPSCRSQNITIRHLKQAVGPEEDAMVAESLAESVPLEDTMHPSALQEIEPPILQPIGSRPKTSSLGASRVRPGKRIYNTANVPGADVAQMRLPRNPFTTKTNRAPAPKTVPPQGPQPKSSGPGSIFTPSKIAPGPARLQPPKAAVQPTAPPPKLDSRPKELPKIVKQHFAPEIDSRDGYTVIPRG